jgi:cupin 2 domain-containing protein
MPLSNLVRGNLFRDLVGDADGESTDLLHASSSVRIERIVSQGQKSPEGCWYDQAEDEWVLLVTGAAVLEFEEKPGPVELVPGDWVSIPAHCRHRVVSTAADSPSVWLAVWPRMPEDASTTSDCRSCA